MHLCVWLPARPQWHAGRLYFLSIWLHFFNLCLTRAHLCLQLAGVERKTQEPEYLRDCIQVPGSAGVLTLNVERPAQTGMFIRGGLSVLHKRGRRRWREKKKVQFSPIFFFLHLYFIWLAWCPIKRDSSVCLLLLTVVGWPFGRRCWWRSCCWRWGYFLYELITNASKCQV